MAKVAKVSGFPEWLPSQRRLEEEIINKIYSQYQLYGYTSIETPSVELLSTLMDNGVAAKEIYALKRALATEDEEAHLGLHFDLTVPFARYIAQHLNELSFPFKRSTLQKVWRGDRPQKGRFREFYQFDIDIVVRDTLPLACDSEIVEVIDGAFAALGLPSHTVRINSRKILEGFYNSLGLKEDVARQVIIEVDKLDKVGESGVRLALESSLGLSSTTIDEILTLARLECPLSECDQVFSTWKGRDPLLDEGINELLNLCQLLPNATLRRGVLDGSLARGLFYYTGLIFEVRFKDFPEYGSLGGGGRYEGLTQRFGAKSLPCVGGSIGVTRLIAMIFDKQLLELPAPCPTQVLVTVLSEEQRPVCQNIASKIRSQGLSTEVFYRAPKLGKQIEYAVTKQIPWVLFINENGDCEVKDLSSQTQASISDITEWARLHSGK